jgi:formate hydrogenlyase subunit 6/NADH:ubiquinone oxidoreductase subunit I
MSPDGNRRRPPAVIDTAGLEALLGALRRRGFAPVGPRVRDGAIVYDEIAALEDLPAGWTDVQDAGRYRLERRPDGALFGYTVGPHSWKKFLLPPRLRLWSAERRNGGFIVFPNEEPVPRLALVGARACELHAIAVQDQVLQQGPFADVHYAARRRNLCIIAVNCGQAGGTCFCASMGTGPRAPGGAYDLALTELLDGGTHRFLVETGTETGAALLDEIPHAPASEAEAGAAERAADRARAQMGRRLEREGLEAKLLGNLDSTHWERVAARCLGCANCTLVCPTCFCTNVEDTTDLAGERAEHVRRWDSCFNLRFSYMNGGPVRGSLAGRYRQWMTHKLANWVEQFGTTGCVGCGRCITWCPAGIDLVAEAAAVAGDSGRPRAPESRG